MAKLMDLTGRRFERLLVVERALGNSRGNAMWACACDCGERVTTRGVSLTNGLVRSCGCLRGDLLAARNKAQSTHGASYTAEYRNWKTMNSRCHSPVDQAFDRYGGRGITVCDRWRGPDGFRNFVADMGPRPPGLTLERKDNDKGYSPENCVWATMLQQGQNRRTNVVVEIDGVSQTLAAWARQHGLDRSTVSSRWRRGIRGEALFSAHRLSPQARQSGGSDD